LLKLCGYERSDEFSGIEGCSGIQSSGHLFFCSPGKYLPARSYRFLIFLSKWMIFLQKARRRSMSTSEFEEGRNRRLSSRIFYHHTNQVSSQTIRVQECMDRPDVTNVAATSMAKSLNISCMPSTNEQESPDLVASGMVMEGATALFTPSTPSSLDTWQTSMATNSPQQPPLPRQFSYCTGPSHMYL